MHELTTRSGSPARHLWGLDAARIHLNHGSYGAAPHSTVARRADLLAEVDANPLAWHLGLEARISAAKDVIAPFVGAQPSELAFVPSASAGTTAVLRALVEGEGEGQVVMTDHAYGALAMHVAREAARVGAHVVTAHVPLDADAAAAVAAITGAMTPQTRLVVIDHITSGSARLLPVEEVIEAAHAIGALVLVDAAHAPGMLEAPASPTADAWVGNLHKWGCGVRGSALLILRGEARERVRPPIESWGSEESFPTSFDVQGAADVSSYLASAEGVATLEAELGWDRIRSFQRDLVAFGRDLIAGEFSRLTGDDHRVAVGMPAPAMALVALPAGLAAHPELGGRLRQRIADELGFETQIAGWGGVARLRLSAHAYSTRADLEAFAERAVPALVKWGRG